MKYFVWITLFVGCAGFLQQKQVINSDISLQGGVYHEKSWDDELKFKRVSWYDQATMLYDIIYTKLDESSPFVNWMGSDRLTVSTCKTFWIALVYAKRNGLLNASGISQQITKAGYRDVIILDFAREFKSHQGFKDWRLSQHRIIGLCSNSEDDRPVELSLPGYTPQEVL